MADTTFQIDVDVDSTSVEPAAVSLAGLAQRLDVASSASTKAAEAVRAGEAAYRAAEAAADRQAKAVEKANVAITEQSAKLKAAMASGDSAAVERASQKFAQLAQRQAEAATKAEQAKLKMQEEATALDKLRAAADKAEKAEEHLKQQQEASAKAAGSGKLNEIAEGFGKLGGPVGQLGQKFFGTAEGAKKLFSSLGDTNGMLAIAGIGIAAITAAVIALTVALVAGVVKLGAWAVGLADVARTNKLLSAGIAGSVDAGDDLDRSIARIQNRIPVSRDELVKMAADLKKAGVQGTALGDALEDAAQKAAQEKFGPEWSKEMLSLSRQGERLQRLVANLFSGLKIEKLLEGLSTLVDLFDESNAAGRAIKTVFEDIFQRLIDGVVEWIPKVRTAFIQFEILAMKALIAIKPFYPQIVFVAKAFAVLAAVVVGVFAAAFAVGVAIAITFWTIVKYFTESLWAGIEAALAFASAIDDGVGSAFEFVSTKVGEAIDYLKSISLSDIGTSMIEGLISGLLGGGPALINSITGLAGGAIDAAKKALGIASPSKIFAEIGAYTTEGFVGGVDQGAPDAASALETMTSPPGITLSSPAASSSSSPSSPSGGGASFEGATFQFYGVKDAEHAKEMFLEAIEGLAMQVAPEAG